MNIKITSLNELEKAVADAKIAGPTAEEIHEKQVQSLCDYVTAEIKKGLLRDNEVIRIPLDATFHSSVQQDAWQALTDIGGYKINRVRDGDITWSLEVKRQSL